MGLFNFFNSKGIDEYVAEAREAKGALIVDVRSPKEFSGGHIKGAVNIPLDQLQKISKKAPDLETPLYVYCLSGARSATACRHLKGMGYADAVNMGGIGRYKGEVVRGGK